MLLCPDDCSPAQGEPSRRLVGSGSIQQPPTVGTTGPRVEGVKNCAEARRQIRELEAAVAVDDDIARILAARLDSAKARLAQWERVSNGEMRIDDTGVLIAAALAEAERERPRDGGRCEHLREIARIFGTGRQGQLLAIEMMKSQEWQEVDRLGRQLTDTNLSADKNRKQLEDAKARLGNAGC